MAIYIGGLRFKTYLFILNIFGLFGFILFISCNILVLFLYVWFNFYNDVWCKDLASIAKLCRVFFFWSIMFEFWLGSDLVVISQEDFLVFDFKFNYIVAARYLQPHLVHVCLIFLGLDLKFIYRGWLRISSVLALDTLLVYRVAQVEWDCGLKIIHSY